MTTASINWQPNRVDHYAGKALVEWREFSVLCNQSEYASYAGFGVTLASVLESLRMSYVVARDGMAADIEGRPDLGSIEDWAARFPDMVIWQGPQILAFVSAPLDAGDDLVVVHVEDLLRPKPRQEEAAEATRDEGELDQTPASSEEGADSDPQGIVATTNLGSARYSLLSGRYAWEITAGDTHVRMASKQQSLAEVIRDEVNDINPEEDWDEVIWKGPRIAGLIRALDDGSIETIRFGDTRRTQVDWAEIENIPPKRRRKA